MLRKWKAPLVVMIQQVVSFIQMSAAQQWAQHHTRRAEWEKKCSQTATPRHFIRAQRCRRWMNHSPEEAFSQEVQRARASAYSFTPTALIRPERCGSSSWTSSLFSPQSHSLFSAVDLYLHIFITSQPYSRLFCAKSCTVRDGIKPLCKHANKMLPHRS